ncbi:MAG: type II secretion system protein [Eubacteriales bacterium]|nr:type II secretion system protein [Eubacteriales bacterium]
MNKRGFTLAELVLSIGILGLIAMALLSMLTTGYTMLFRTRKFAEDAYVAQQLVEVDMESARIAEASLNAVDVDVFGNVVTGHLISRNIESDGLSHGEINVFISEPKVVYDVPVVDSVTLSAFRDESLTTSTYLFPLNNEVTFEGSYTDTSIEDDSNFLLNVYRWYMSPVELNPLPDYRNWTIVKEWNETRPEVLISDVYDKSTKTFSAIPNMNIGDNFNVLDLATEFEMSDEEVSEHFAGRTFVYSVTPYSVIGRIGEEVFCENPISTNKILNINPIFLSVEWDGSTDEMDLRDSYSLVEANMLDNNNLNVNVTWDEPVVELWDPNDPINSGRTEDIHTGSVIGYPAGVTLHLVMTDNIITQDVDSVTVNGTALIEIPTSGSKPIFFNAEVKDGIGNTINDAIVTWDIQNENSQLTNSYISINGNVVVITIPSSFRNDDFDIRATYDDISNDPMFPVKILKASTTYSSHTRTTNNSTSTYIATIKGDNNTFIKELTIGDFYVKLGGSTKSLLAWDQDANNNGDLYNIVFNDDNRSNGVYTFTIQAKQRNGDTTGGVSIRYSGVDLNVSIPKIN